MKWGSIKTMEKDSLTFHTFKNASYGFIGYLWPMAFSFFITPIIVLSLGIKSYGIYIFINTIISIFGLLDLGLGTAVTKHLSSYHGRKEEGSMRRLIHSANSLFLIVAIVGFCISVLIAFTVSSLAGGRFAAYSQYSSLFLIAGGIFFVSTASQSYSGILTALQRFDITTRLNLISLTLSNVAILIIALTSRSLNWIFISQLIINVVFAFLIYRQARKILPLSSFRLGWDRKEVRSSYIFALVTFINSVATSALTYLDRLIIPFFVGPSNLTYYSVPGNVTSKIPGLSNTLGTMMFPLASQLEGGKDKVRIDTLYVRSFRLIVVVAASLTVTIISFAPQILLYWLNANFELQSTQIMIILAITNFILALSGPLSAFLLGLGKLKFLTWTSIITGILNAALLLVLLPIYGIIGAAWAYLFSLLPVIYMVYRTETKYLDLPKRGRYYAKQIWSISLISLILFGVNIFLFSHLINSLLTLLIVGGSSVVIYILLYKFFGFFEKDDWKDIELFFSVILDRFRLNRESR